MSIKSLTFRLSDEQKWASEPFEADSPETLAAGIRGAWDVVIAARSHCHPALALRAELAAIEAMLREQLSRPNATDEQRRSWEANAAHSRFVAERDLGGRSARLHLHVRSEIMDSVWLAPGNRGSGPIVERTVDLRACVRWLDDAARIVEHDRNISSLCEQVGESVQRVQFPGLQLVCGGNE